MLVSLLIFLCGALVSGFGTMVGFGGGIFMIPILVIVFGVKMHLAVGAVALALFPAALIATAFNMKQKSVDYLAALWLEAPTMVGAVGGAYLTTRLSVENLELGFALFLFYLAYILLRSKHSNSTRVGVLVEQLKRLGPRKARAKLNVPYELSLVPALLFGGASGVVAGLFGIGGGVLKMPIMIKVFAMPPTVAVATSLFMIVFTSGATATSHFSLGHVDMALAVPVVSGFVGGALLGTIAKKNIGAQNTELMIGFAVLLAACSVSVHALFM